MRTSHPQTSPASAETRSRANTAQKPFFTVSASNKTAEEPVQANPAISRPGDRWEREADHMAGRATEPQRPGSGPALATQVTPVSASALREDQAQAKAVDAEKRTPTQELSEAVQPMADTEADDAEAVQREADSSDPEALTETDQSAMALQARAEMSHVPGAGVLAANLMARARGKGDALPPNVRDKMQSRFGADFSGVRIHTDSSAVQISRLLRAQAVTRGADIFFNSGRFDTATAAGQHLLAHELTHTLQQGAATAAADGSAPLQLAAAPVADDSYQVRPEVLAAIGLARAEEGKVNAKMHGADGKRIGWQRLQAYFETALGGPVIHPSIIAKVTPAPGKGGAADILPSWCGIFTWWAMKKAGIPIPDWKLGAVPLDALKTRAKTEMPHKGDIAIKVLPNNHFAMVTGLESIKDAEGKPKKLTRIATINGNTAGEDNLGGQVQEKWHTLGNWDHFLDPVGKVQMPPAEMITVTRTPDPPDQGRAADPPPALAVPDPATRAAEAAKDATMADLETNETEAPAPEAGPDALPLADLTLPPRKDAGPADVVAVVTAVSLEGTSDQATVAYLGAGPSALAAAQPGFAGVISSKMGAEQKEIADSPPVLKAQTSGLDDLPLTPAPDVILPQGEIAEGSNPDDPGPIGNVQTEATQPFTGNADRESALDEEDSGGFFDRLMNYIKKFTSDIRTNDPSVDTSAGPAPGIDLTKDADPGEMNQPRDEAAASVAAARDAQVKGFQDSPGQENIQPRAVDEDFDAAPTLEAPAPIEEGLDTGMAEYAAAPIPEDVRAAADGKIAVKLEASLAGPRADVEAAATTRDDEKAAGIKNAEEEAATINSDADTAQRNAVIDNREKVAKLQGEGMAEAHGAVNDFNKEAASEQSASRKDIATHVREEEGKAKAELSKGEAEAKDLKTKAEAEAAAEKVKLKEAEKKESWWDKVKNTVKSVVKAITKLIDGIFTKLRDAVKKAITWAKNAAIGLINKARNWVVDKINKFRTWAKDKVNKYLGDTFPALAKRINGAIDAVADGAVKVVNKVADGAIAAVKFVADKLSKFLDKVLQVFQTALKTAVRVAGAVATGDFAEALRAVIEGACEIAGVSPQPIFDFFDRAGKAVNSILKDPLGFIGNLFSAVGKGISLFFEHIRTHMIKGVIGWLTGALSEVELTGPFEFTVSGILKIVAQILGLTYANIKAKIIKEYPPSAKVFDLVEKGLAFVQKLIAEGPMALIDDIIAHIGDLKETVMGAIREWLITTALKEAAVWLLSLTNPASAIVKAIKLVFDLVMFLVERFQQIKDFVISVYDAVAAMASGNFAAVSKGVEDALARSIPVVISLIATVAGLGNIAKKVKGVIEKITKPINKIIDKVVKKIVAFAKKIVAKVKGLAGKAKKKAKDAVKKLIDWWKVKRGFKDESGHKHTLAYKGSKSSAKLTVASTNPTQIDTFLKDRAKQAAAGGTSYTPADVAAASAYHTSTVKPAEAALAKADTGGKKAKEQKAVDENKALVTTLKNALDHLGTTWLSHFFSASDDKDFPPAKLPVMADNAKATSFEADYIVAGTKKNGYKNVFKKGTESHAHVGNLDGWPKLQGAKLTTGGAKYVRMHLLPHRLGGDAVDSNLTPARGDLFNTPFSGTVEQPAFKASTEGDEMARKPVWYSFKINYHPASATPPPGWTAPTFPADAFPSLLEARAGFYKARKKGDKTILRGKTEFQKKDTPSIPSMTAAPPAINRDGPTALQKAIENQDKSVTMYFVTNILIANRTYTSKTDMKKTLWLKYGGVQEEVRRKHVTATYDAVGKYVTMD